jgi:hypothetical protein
MNTAAIKLTWLNAWDENMPIVVSSIFDTINFDDVRWLLIIFMIEEKPIDTAGRSREKGEIDALVRDLGSKGTRLP